MINLKNNREENFTMNDNTRNEFASYGLEILKRSVLLVLHEQHVKGLDRSFIYNTWG